MKPHENVVAVSGTQIDPTGVKPSALSSVGSTPWLRPVAVRVVHAFWFAVGTPAMMAVHGKRPAWARARAARETSEAKTVTECMAKEREGEWSLDGEVEARAEEKCSLFVEPSIPV